VAPVIDRDKHDERGEIDILLVGRGFQHRQNVGTLPERRDHDAAAILTKRQLGFKIGADAVTGSHEAAHCRAKNPRFQRFSCIALQDCWL
jgi:hypothetical protein